MLGRTEDGNFLDMRSSEQKTYFERLKDSLLNTRWIAVPVLTLAVLTGIISFGDQIVRIYGSLVRPSLAEKYENTVSDARVRLYIFLI